MLILWQTGSVHHKILIFCCFDFSARCLSNGTTGCPDYTPAPLISCCSSLQSVPAWSGLLYGTIGDNSHSCHPFCTFSVADLNLNLNLKTDKRQRAQQSTSLVSFWGFPCATKMPTVHGLQQASELESELDLDLGILRQAVLSYSLDRDKDIRPDRDSQTTGVWVGSTAGESRHNLAVGAACSPDRFSIISQATNNRCS